MKEKIQILVIGNSNQVDFKFVVDSLGNRPDLVLNQGSVDSLRQISPERIPDAVLFLQTYPGEFSSNDFHFVRKIFPTLPILLVAGTWCEGEMRTGKPIPVNFRFYASQITEEEISCFSRINQPGNSVFTLPATAGDDEILLRKTASRLSVPLAEKRQNCLVVSNFGPLGNDSAMNRLLGEQIVQRGDQLFFSDCFDGKSLIDNVLADSDDSPPPRILEAVQRLRGEFADADITVYVNSPRIDEKENLIAAGANHVAAKPYCFL